MKKKGFTLIELLVVISIIALLVSILMPALGKARRLAQQVHCLNNQGQIIKAVIMFAEDNKGLVPQSNTGPGGWVNWPRNESGGYYGGTVGYQATAEQKNQAVREGTLYKYLNDVNVYHCAGDRRIMQAGGWSYSMMDGLGNVNYVSRLAQIHMPSDKLFFIEELDVRNGQVNLNLNSFALASPFNWTVYQWTDVPATFHGNGATAAWADGHAAVVRWEDPRTVKLHGKYDSGGIPAADATNNADILMLKRHWPRTRSQRIIQ